jgi:hypothetical protein
MTEKMNRAPRLNSRWSSSDDAILTMMAENNKTTAEIATVLGRTKASIWSRKCTLGLHDTRLGSSAKDNDVPTSLSSKKRMAKVEAPKAVKADWNGIAYTLSPTGRKTYSRTFINMILTERRRTGATYRSLGEKYGIPFQMIGTWAHAESKREAAKKLQPEFEFTDTVTVRDTPIPTMKAVPVMKAKMTPKFEAAAAARVEKTAPVEQTFDNVLKVGQEEIIQKAAAIAKAHGLKLTVLHFE